MIRKIYFAVFISILCFVILISCGEKKAYDIKIEKETIDFGTVDAGVTLEIIFKFKNTGKEDLEIQLIKPTCGCTVPGNWDKKIKPGKTGKVPVTFNTEAFEGEVSKVVYLATNIPERPSIQLTLKGKVYNPVQIMPKTILLDDIKDENKPIHGSFEIKNNRKTPLLIDEIIPPDNKTTFNLVTLEKNQLYRLDFTVYPPFEREVVTDKTIIIKPTNKKDQPIKLTYTYFLPPPVQVSPMVVPVYINEVSEVELERRINIKSNIELPISILDVKLDGTGIKYSVVELLKDKFYQIPLVFPKGLTFPADKKVFYLTFKVKNDPKDKLYSIAIEEHLE